MGHISYHRVCSGKISSSCYGSCRGFKLNLRRNNAIRLRKRLAFFLTLFDKWKSSCVQALPLLKKVFRRRNGFKRNNRSRCGLVREEKADDFRLRSYGRSDSFHAEAIADCLEFIKKTSISMEQIENPVSHIQDKNS